MKLQSQVRGASDPENLLSSPTQKERKEYRVFFQNQTTPKVIYSVRERELGHSNKSASVSSVLVLNSNTLS